MADSASPLGLFGTLRLLLNSFPPDAPPYCVIGALAVGAWGRPRATNDIDLLILLEESTRREFTGRLGSAGFRSEERRVGKERRSRGSLSQERRKAHER